MRREPLWVWLAVVLAVTAGAGAATINVPGDHATIQAAIGAASPGDTIQVAAGIYSERLTIDKSITLRGAQAGVDPTASGARTDAMAESVITKDGLAWANPDVLVDVAAGVTGVTIDGFTLLGDPLAANADTCVVRCGGSAGTANNVTIANNIMNGRFGVLLKNGGNCVVAGNRMTVNATGFVCQASATDLTISGNTFTSGSAPTADSKAIYLTGVVGATISDNTASGFPWDALAGSGNTQVTISGNTFTNCRKGVSFWGATTFVSISGNTFSNMASHGIDIKGADLTITGNVISNNAANGLTIDKNLITTERVAVHGNSITGNGGFGLEVTSLVTEAVQSQGNWWGAADGPAGVGPGSGDGVSANVVFDPWYTDEAMTGLASAKPILNITQATAHDTLEEAVGAALAGDTIQVAAGTYAVPAQISLNKADLTIVGAGSADTILEVSGTGYRFRITAPGVTIENLQIRKTDKAGLQNIIYIGASNVTIRNNVICGQYVLGDGDTTRAMEITGGLSDLLIEGNTIHNLRQPAYINKSAGTIRDNYVHSTRGWVISDGSSMTFTGNTWGSGVQANALDIAIIVDSPATPPPGFYPDIAALSAANNDAVIEDQRVTPRVLSVVYVDAAAPTAGDGTAASPCQTIAAGVTRVAAGGTIHVAAGTYVEQVEIAKDLTLAGAGSGTVIRSPATLSKSFTTTAVNKPVVYVHDAAGVVIENLVLDGDGKGNANYRFVGIAYHNAGGRIEDCVVRNVQDTPFSGSQHGIGIGAYNTDSTARSLTIADCDLYNIQKGCVVVSGAGLAVDIRGTTVKGVGPTGVTAQNGIQVSSGVTGQVVGNTATGFYYTGASWAASAIMSFGDGVSLLGNYAALSNFGLYVDSASGGTVAGNCIVGNDWGLISNCPAPVNAQGNWWGMPAGAGWSGTAHGDGVYDYQGTQLDVSSPLAKPDPVQFPNAVYLQPSAESIFVKTTDTVYVDMRVANLQQMVSGLQAMLHFSSDYFSTAAADVSVTGGGGVWDEPFWFVYGEPGYQGSGVAGDLDSIVTVNATAPAGTDADACVAIIALKPTGQEGVTQVTFREDDPVLDTKQTFFGSMTVPAVPIWPSKIHSTNIYVDGTAPAVTNLAATQGGADVLNGAAVTVQGVVQIQVDATDNLAGWDTYPAVTVSQGSNVLPVTFVEQTGNTYTYTIEVGPATANGTWTIEVVATDKAGNATTVSGTLDVNKNQVTGQIQLEGFIGTSRQVTFVVTAGATTRTYSPTLSFSGGLASYTLTDVPEGATAVSAKTAWNLRSRLAVSPADGQATADFTGGDQLLAGDINGSNSINTLDYSLLKVRWNSTDPAADINGDGQVQTLDYSLMKTNWFKVGDPQ